MCICICICMCVYIYIYVSGADADGDANPPRRRSWRHCLKCVFVCVQLFKVCNMCKIDNLVNCCLFIY